MAEAEAEDFRLGYCQSGLPSCRGGQRRVREYNGLLMCDHCWPHRKRAPGRRDKTEKVRDDHIRSVRDAGGD